MAIWFALIVFNSTATVSHMYLIRCQLSVPSVAHTPVSFGVCYARKFINRREKESVDWVIWTYCDLFFLAFTKWRNVSPGTHLSLTILLKTFQFFRFNFPVRDAITKTVAPLLVSHSSFRNTDIQVLLNLSVFKLWFSGLFLATMLSVRRNLTAVQHARYWDFHLIRVQWKFSGSTLEISVKYKEV